jgi:hypothetical protein
VQRRGSKRAGRICGKPSRRYRRSRIRSAARVHLATRIIGRSLPRRRGSRGTPYGASERSAASKSCVEMNLGETGETRAHLRTAGHRALRNHERSPNRPDGASRKARGGVERPTSRPYAEPVTPPRRPGLLRRMALRRADGHRVGLARGPPRRGRAEHGRVEALVVPDEREAARREAAAAARLGVRLVERQPTERTEAPGGGAVAARTVGLERAWEAPS